MEKIPNQEQGFKELLAKYESGELSEREFLHALENLGVFVFHGSPTPDIVQLEPRQAHNWPDKKTKVPDGPPGVAATPYANIAIFSALLKSRKGRTTFGSDGQGHIYFGASKAVLEQKEGVEGYVYVLDKEKFHPKTGYEFEMDWRSEEQVKPRYTIKVDVDDLPDNIEEIDD